MFFIVFLISYVFLCFFIMLFLLFFRRNFLQIFFFEVERHKINNFQLIECKIRNFLQILYIFLKKNRYFVQKSCFGAICGWRLFLKGAWLKNRKCKLSNFYLKSCARLQSKWSWNVTAIPCCVAEILREKLRGGHYGPPPGKRSGFRLSHFFGDEIFLTGRGSKTVHPGAPNLVSKFARYLKEKSHETSRRRRVALRRYCAHYGPPPPGKVGLKGVVWTFYTKC